MKKLLITLLVFTVSFIFLAGVALAVGPYAGSSSITVIYNDKKKIANAAYERVGYLTATATNDATSIDAFQILLLLTHKMGSDVVHLTRQGVDFSMFATGWGASIGGVSGGLNANGEGGQVASGMLGWATGKSGANRDPWLQGVCLELLP